MKLAQLYVSFLFALNVAAQSDTTPPVIALTFPTTGDAWEAEVAPQRVTGTATDGTGVTRVTWANDRGGSGTTSSTTNWSVAVPVRHGINVITFRAYDAANNAGTFVLTVDLSPDDTVPPSMWISKPEHTYMPVVTQASVIGVSGPAWDASGITHVTWSNGRGASGEALIGEYRFIPYWGVNMPLQPGANHVVITVYDAANNSFSDSIVIERGVPNLRFAHSEGSHPLRLTLGGGRDRSRFRPGDTIAASWTVVNNGTASTGWDDVSASYKASDDYRGYVSSTGLYAGHSVSHTADLGPMPRGAYLLHVHVATGTSEIDLTDNDAERTFFVGGSMVRADFNFDETPDILWQHAATSQNYLWYMNENALVAGANLNNNGPGWKLAGVGDFDGDGSPDLVHQDPATSALRMWLMLDTEIVAVIDPPIPGPNWSVVAAADFNRDGRDDLLFQHGPTNQVYVWHLNRHQVVGEGNVNTVGTRWRVAGTGDFNADGNPDIVWRNAVTGQNYLWYMNGRDVVGEANISAEVNLEWRIGSVADYSGDGKPDLLWQFAPTGQLVLWVMNGNQRLEDRNMNHVGSAEWRVAGPK